MGQRFFLGIKSESFLIIIKDGKEGKIYFAAKDYLKKNSMKRR
jgi:hypothetical protein